MLHIIGTKYRFTVMSIHVSIVNAWTLTVNIPTDTAAACLHLLYAANNVAMMVQQHHIRHRQMADMHCQCPEVQLGHHAT